MEMTGFRPGSPPCLDKARADVSREVWSLSLSLKTRETAKTPGQSCEDRCACPVTGGMKSAQGLPGGLYKSTLAPAPSQETLV